MRENLLHLQLNLKAAIRGFLQNSPEFRCYFHCLALSESKLFNTRRSVKNTQHKKLTTSLFLANSYTTFNTGEALTRAIDQNVESIPDVHFASVNSVPHPSPPLISASVS